LKEPDFDALYRELGMPEGGTLEALKQRYRRRVAQWHPDRDLGAVQGQERLKALNLRYSALLEYHRRHGRLPPAPRPPVSQARGSAVLMPEAHSRDAAPTNPRRPIAWLLLALAAGGTWLLWPRGEASAPSASELARSAPAWSAAEKPAPDRELRRGLDRRAVLRLLGEPIMRDDRTGVWSYGPSWVRFECGRVVGWYSSPLFGLRVEGVRPGVRVGLGPGGPRRACAPELPLALDD
jgi:hypothetical protein